MLSRSPDAEPTGPILQLNVELPFRFIEGGNRIAYATRPMTLEMLNKVKATFDVDARTEGWHLDQSGSGAYYRNWTYNEDDELEEFYLPDERSFTINSFSEDVYLTGYEYEG